MSECGHVRRCAPRDVTSTFAFDARRTRYNNIILNQLYAYQLQLTRLQLFSCLIKKTLKKHFVWKTILKMNTQLK